jgi:hypothetical protein
MSTGNKMDKDFFHEKYVIADYLFSSRMTKAQIAKEMDISLRELNEKLRCYNLEWVTTKKRKMSRGQAAIVQIIQKILPNEKIEYELHLGERLYLDIYIPTYKIGIEYHGRQHYEWVPFFHATEADFILAQRRDIRKEELCAEKGISLVAFRYNDSLSEDTIFARVLEAIRSCPSPELNAEEVDPELELKRKKYLASARQRRSTISKELKNRREHDHEYQKQQKEFRKLQRERRRKLRRDNYFDISDDSE